MLSENFFSKNIQQLTTLNGEAWERVNLRFALVNRTYLRNIVVSTLVPINYSMIVATLPEFVISKMIILGIASDYSPGLKGLR